MWTSLVIIFFAILWTSLVIFWASFVVLRVLLMNLSWSKIARFWIKFLCTCKSDLLHCGLLRGYIAILYSCIYIVLCSSTGLIPFLYCIGRSVPFLYCIGRTEESKSDPTDSSRYLVLARKSNLCHSIPNISDSCTPDFSSTQTFYCTITYIIMSF